MSLFDKFEQTRAGRKALAERGITSNVVMEKVISPTEAVINGRPMILAGTNNYLGLTFDPDCIDAAANAVRELGTGTTGSRMANGTYSSHVQPIFSDANTSWSFPPGTLQTWPCYLP